MRLTEFRYLRKRRILTLGSILALSSTLFSVTAFSLLGFYAGFDAYLGRGEDIVTIYSTRSRTPFAGLVPTYLAERIGIVNGVLAYSPEAIAPCFMGDEPIFLRGIIPEDFTDLTRLAIIYGEMLELNDTDSVIVGRALAERLKVKHGDKILVLGVLADRYMELSVSGIYESHSAVDDEALAPLSVGQWLRGADQEHVTLIRFKIDRNVASPSMIFQEVANEASELTIEGTSGGESQKPTDELIVPRVRTHFRIEDVGVEEVQRLMKSYMDRYGVTKEALLILSIMVFLFSSASAASASRTIIGEHKGEIEILKSIGASKKTIKTDILFKLLPWSLISSAAGILMAAATLTVIHQSGFLQVLSHRALLQFEPLVIIINFLLVSLLVSIVILRSDLK